MSWVQNSLEGYWSRPLDCHDRLFQFIGDMGKPLGREHWLLIGGIQLEAPSDIDLIPRLRAAWKSLRLRHPDIALKLHPDEKRYYPIKDADALEAWCDMTLRVESTVHSLNELQAADHLCLSKPHATCHWIPASNEICIVSAHWRWDGCGHWMVFNQLLSELESPSQLPSTFDGSEAHRLVPSLDAVVGMPATRDDDWDRRADELLATFLKGQPSIGLPIAPERKAALPGTTRRTELRVPAEVATALRQACREQGITLTTTLHASAIVETAHANPTNSDSASRYISWLAFNVRKYCPPPFDGPIHGPSLRLVGLPINVNARAPWNELVRVIQPLYRQSWDLKTSDMLFVRVPFVEKATAMFQTPLPADTPLPTEPNINSLGAMEAQIKAQYGIFKVRDMTFMVHMVSQQLYVHCWSWKDVLYISASYNESYYEPVEVERWLTAVKENLVANLLPAEWK
ncbi:hypothetical protein BJY04DRAFT_229431 [Aspergillus karnatakaensis]|uniref:uncharacterized protein n=1 Tax=Aspergillus karnatakaensis TaxID=1810916 RepID=UPI003CCD83AC